MSESGQRQRVVKALKKLHAIPVENPMRPGTPDVNYIEGWIELKWLCRWPKKSETVVALTHFEPWQRRWLAKRWNLGGNSWLILQCKSEWFLFTGEAAALHVGNCTREDLYTHAYRVWRRGLKDKELMECLSTDWDGLPVARDS